MVDQPEFRADRYGLEEALSMLAEEQRKLEEFQRRMNEASTTVESANKMVAATFDGRGELVRLEFTNTRYRTMAPAELASLLLETLRRGREKSFAKVSELAGRDVLPGVSFGQLAAGKVDLHEMTESMMRSMLDLSGIVDTTGKKESQSDGG
ncbi:YbaB/EbfC family nucleoid-associated protein [Micromonospora sp. HNM0581]|uniref:YbaB/EbfC family nucleoid-associated protein n=1 Tax=Micromonospora sp. HNM0581 TaxID=2716341 RepID=UPI001469B1F1|nr:YbaB/EbfC family nucleoid-associated protein [Micromonospora sp. HNM0581]NLU81065.1 YbaB/EbfC family nucleoid-associated protein [Micromonospora sp. HNM0581]